MAGSGPETAVETKGIQPPAEAKGTRQAATKAGTAEQPTTPRRRRNRKDNPEPSSVERFFLAGATGNGDTPALGREVASESEAIVEAFQERVNFFTVSEFRTRAEISSSSDPILKKEAVENGHHSS